MWIRNQVSNSQYPTNHSQEFGCHQDRKRTAKDVPRGQDNWITDKDHTPQDPLHSSRQRFADEIPKSSIQKHWTIVKHHPQNHMYQDSPFLLIDVHHRKVVYNCHLEHEGYD